MHLHCPFKCVFLCVNESCYSSTFILPQSNHHYILYKFLVLSIDLSSVTEHRCNIHIRSLAHSRKCRGATKNGFTCFCTDDSSGNWQHRTVENFTAWPFASSSTVWEPIGALSRSLSWGNLSATPPAKLNEPAGQYLYGRERVTTCYVVLRLNSLSRV